MPKCFAHKHKFLIHLARNTVFGFLLIILSLSVGMLGYHVYEHMPWIDAFVNAAMILSGMGPLTPLMTFGGKLFAGLYALFSGLAFIALIALIFAPVVHRFFRKIHLETESDEKNAT
jgi:hypothetical protein